VIIYFLREPYFQNNADIIPDQYFELHNRPGDVWWIDGLHQCIAMDKEWKFCRFVASEGQNEFVYKIDTNTKIIEKL
jgi:hypothetical protein